MSVKISQRIKCYSILKHFGHETQVDKTLEELCELDEALRFGNLNEIIGELADVEIMIEQIKESYGVQSHVDKTIDIKIERTQQRIKDGYYE